MVCNNRLQWGIRAKGTLKKSFLPPRWRLLMGQIIQCLGGKTGGLDQISNKDATILYCLENKVKVDYAKLIWNDIIHKLSKKTREKVVPYPSVHNWTLKPNQTEGPPFTDHMKAICNLDVPVDSKAPNPSVQTEEASKSKTGQSKKETQSSSAKDKSPSHPSPPTLVVGEMHKEEQQAAGGPTSLGATSEEGAHPQLSSDQTKSTRDGLKTTHTDSDLLKDTRSALFTPDFPQDEPIIVLDESEEEEEVDKDKDTHATSHDKDELEQQKAKAEAEITSLKSRPSYPDIKQLTDLLVSSLKPEFSKLLASHEFASCLPTKLKELPSKFIELSREIKELKKHVKDMEIELPGDLKEIPTKLENFTSTISSLTSQVAELKNIQWELPTEFLDLPSPLKIGRYLHFSLCSGTETEEGLWNELQFSLVDNFKLNIVYLLNRSL
ncbi:hypothetical protein Tco_0369692 [Tanacetum coccineum]